MADFLDFMLGKKDSSKKKVTINEEKNNYSIFMPVGVYEGDSEEDFERKPNSNEDSFDFKDDQSYSGWNNRSKSEPNLEGGRRGEFDPYSIERMNSEAQLVELKMLITAAEDEKKRLNDIIVGLKNENNELAVDKSRHAYVAATYRSMVEKIVKIMPYYQEIEFTGVGTPEQWKDRQLVEIFVTCIEQIKVQLNSKLKEIEQLKASKPVAQPSSNKTSSASAMMDMDLPDLDTDISTENGAPDMEFPDIFDQDMPDIMGMSEIPDINPMDIESLSKYTDKFDDVQLKVILETIGETGISRVVDLKETDSFKRTFVNGNGEFNQGVLSKKIKVLEDLDIVSVEKINTGRKGGYENIYSLSDLGRQLYQHIFAAQAVESEKDVVRRQHTSLEHGYFIKTLSKELENKGYEVFDSHEDCIRRPLVANSDGDDKLRVEADLIIKKDGVEYIVECEMGTTSDADMNKKLDKLVLVTNVISFVMNNQESLNATSAKVDKWITKKGRESLKGYTFRFTTIDTLKKREVWQNKGPF